VQPEPSHHAAANALANGDPLAALNAIVGDTGGHARALRGIAFAQLDELDEARRELRAAAEALRDEPLYRARALAALAEIAAARRELGTAPDALAEAADALEANGDVRNATWARLVRARVLLLVGDLGAARAELQRSAEVVASGDPVIAGAHELARTAAAIRALSGKEALVALDAELGRLANEAHPLLAREIDAHREALARPLARLTLQGRTTELALPQLSRVFRGDGGLPFEEPECAARRWLVVDSIARRVAFCGENAVDLSARDVLFALVLELGRAWPGEVTSDSLVAAVFDGPPGEASHQDRLRVELGRLRRLLPPGVSISAMGGAWRLELGPEEVLIRLELLRVLMVAGIRYYPGFVTVEPWWLERGNPVFVTTLV
jgi:tetratricopeptide (TPR) repeat protein